MSRVRNDDAVARLRLTGDGAGNVQPGSAEDLAFQLTDAQFSVIAVATPGNPSVVIDRIAYTPYGESTRTLRSDVNGDGMVNKDDYDGVIQPLKGQGGTDRVDLRLCEPCVVPPTVAWHGLCSPADPWR